MHDPTFPRFNNLQWLRLIFAIQVVWHHSAEHIGLWIPKFVEHFPGVPAFFFVSGFLIYAAWQNAPGQQYFLNRFYRLWPALIFVTIGAVGVAIAAHGLDDLLQNKSIYAVWFVAQITIGQAYNPEHFRDIGVGVLNGALWTITTEIIFYICVPVITLMEKYFKHTIYVLIAVSFVIYAVGPYLFNDLVIYGQPLFRYLSITPIVWGWMFGIGIISFKNYRTLEKYLKYTPIALVGMILLIFIDADGPLLKADGNNVGILYFIFYCSLILFLAFKTPFLKLEPDFSYGMYIWHMPIMNYLLVVGMATPFNVFAAVFAVAAISWFAIERPALRLKKASMLRV